MQTLSALGDGLRAATCDVLNSTHRGEILEVKQMKKLLLQSSVLLLLLGVMSTSHSQGNENRYIPAYCDQGHSIQDAVDKATEGATIDVWGTCREAVVIDKDRLRITTVSDAVIMPPAGSAAFTVNADNVEIGNFNIVGGRTGIEIAGGASAEVHHNHISDYTGNGIRVVGNSNGAIHDNYFSSTSGNLSAIILLSSASAQIESNQIAASSRSGISIASASSALVGCNQISVSHPFFAGIHVNRTSHLAFGCTNTISNSHPFGEAIVCSQTSSIFAGATQDITAGAIDLHPNCEVVTVQGVTFP